MPHTRHVGFTIPFTLPRSGGKLKVMPQARWERFQVEPNPKDLAALAESHRPLVYSVCRRYLHDPHDVEDAAQETFLAHPANA